MIINDGNLTIQLNEDEYVRINNTDVSIDTSGKNKGSFKINAPKGEIAFKKVEKQISDVKVEGQILKSNILVFI